jgi:hypothetical protein
VINEWPKSHFVLTTCQANVRGSIRDLVLGRGTHKHSRGHHLLDQGLWPVETNHNALALLAGTNWRRNWQKEQAGLAYQLNRLHTRE